MITKPWTAPGTPAPAAPVGAHDLAGLNASVFLITDKGETTEYTLMVGLFLAREALRLDQGFSLQTDTGMELAASRHGKLFLHDEFKQTFFYFDRVMTLFARMTMQAMLEAMDVSRVPQATAAMDGVMAEDGFNAHLVPDEASPN